MKAHEYGFRLLSKETGRVERDWDWRATTEEARIHFIRQAHNGEFNVQLAEREKRGTDVAGSPAVTGLTGV